ncbi:hypothetical protein DTO164E3_8662 [Paecilomyces variotii]|nr:hypothetical protein DTO164E3_8662 [Paecilomyces variotii]KAJ9191972.1 hypothetical protein DTO032I3_8536 [Paecilomyces variotii]KAJ9275429.1 hypothetical protein DTO021D3_7725 [Paecilomyces variotii]KAJ9340013.1 hypothetical protein DTO027B6_7463 [Paecilomyces variotii]KAJ9358017.1 hypothetical protein DTO027B9_2587 [Paecilomyces variotii]
MFLGLGITLWIQKCLAMIIFQNKIIYMPSIPPLARWETIEDYAPECRPLRWREESIKSEDGVRISLVVGDAEGNQVKANVASDDEVHLVILYFQGNASSLPPRLPFLSSIIKKSKKVHQISFVALSYRGYWHSQGKPSQKGIERDARAAMQWVLRQYSQVPNVRISFWGQSVGAGAATGLAAEYLEKGDSEQPPLVCLVLETPFTNMRDLLRDFYPQKWLPYHYLSPFLRNHWDSEQALRRIARAPGLQKPDILIAQAEQDEIVPRQQSERLETFCRSLDITVNRHIVPKALHNDVMVKADGQKAIADFLSQHI